ncbi:hypothetical protein JCM8547_007343 [Rhodosporidiobolus lusitaniae]
MPLFSSRRKSEANLRASASPEQPPALPPTGLAKLVSGRAPSGRNEGGGARGQQARSRSTGREGGGRRPEREREAVGRQGAQAQVQARGRKSIGENGWDLLDEFAPTGGGAAGVPHASQTSESTPVAARFASRAGGAGYATPPRRDSSLASSSSTALFSNPSFSPPNSSVSNLNSLVASPPFFASTPPTSDGGHDGFSLDDPKPNGISQAFSSADLYSSNVHSSPSNSFLRSPPHQPSSSSSVRPAPAGLPPSSSFYDMSAASTYASPVRPPRRESLMKQGESRAFSIEEEREEESPTASPLGSKNRIAIEGMLGAGGRRESLQAARRAAIRTDSPSRTAYTNGTSPLAALSNAATAASRPPPSLLSSASSLSSSSFTGAPAPPRPAYNSFAAFFGTSSAPSSVGSPALSGSTFGSPALAPGFSSEDGSSTTATDATSVDGEEEHEKEEEKKEELAPPIDLRSSSTPFRTAPGPAPLDGTTPTQALFPSASQPSSNPAPPAHSPVEVEKAASPPPTRLSLEQQRSQPAPVSSPVERKLRRESLPPTSPSSSGSRYSRPSFEQARQRPLDEDESNGRAGRRPSVAQAASPLPASPVERKRKDSQVSSGSARHSLLQQYQQPAEESPQSRSGTTSRTTSSGATSRTPKPLPPPLVSSSLPPRPATPTSSSATRSPRTPRAPLTPRSPRPVPPPLDLSAATASSPTKKRVTAEGTTRAAALAAARERERKAAQVSPARSRAESVSPVVGKKEVEEAEPEQQEEEECPLRPRFEYAFVTHTAAILQPLLQHIGLNELVALRQVSKTIRRALDVGEGKELVLERFLGAQGYRSFASSTKSRHAPSSRAAKYVPPPDTITLDLRDLLAFRAGVSLSLDDYFHLARQYSSSPQHFSPTSLKLARATTRGWNRVVLRIRSQTLLPPKAFNAPAFPDLAPASQPVHKPGRAAALRVWVPTESGQQVGGDAWMTDAEVCECEREVVRSGGAWAQLRKGDVVRNVAVEAFGNVGALLFDGRYLRDLSFSYDVVGHLPPWLNMLAYSPSYYHNIVVSSSSNPVFYISLAPFVSSVRETIQLCNDRVELSSPQGQYMVKKFVYRAGIKIKPGQLIGDSPVLGGSGPGGIDVVHDDWVGEVVVETDGTTEHATMLIARVASVEPTPWRIIRSKCRVGRLFLRPVLKSEAC